MPRSMCGSDGCKPSKDGKADKPKQDHPPAEDDFGGGDFVSPVQQPSTDDDKPLE